MSKRYIFTETKGTFTRREYKTRPMTVAEAVEYYGYTLECGASYEHERGNKKVNRNPKTLDSLLKALHNATNNSARNGCGSSFQASELEIA